jgi:hypothetical protein
VVNRQGKIAKAAAQKWGTRVVAASLARLVTVTWIVALLCHRADADLVRQDGAAWTAAELAAGVAAGEVVAGTGVIEGSSNPAAPWTMDGAVQGISLDEPITVTGVAGGSGTFDNVAFAGAFSPGHSPALITVGNTIYTSSNNLIMELGGLLPGSQHDKIVHNGIAVAGGTLSVVLINAFTPAAGNAFDIFDWNGGIAGTFATVSLPALNVGLVWDTSDLYVGGQIVVTAVPEAGALLLTSAGGCLIAAGGVWRRSRRGLISKFENLLGNSAS